jgi:translation initiation factor IF-2
MSNEEQMKPEVWAKSKGVTTDLVMKLLRENGVEVRTQFSLVPAAAFASISAKVTEEKAKIEARKAKKSVHSSESDNSRSPVSAGTRKSGVVLTSTVKGGP